MVIKTKSNKNSPMKRESGENNEEIRKFKKMKFDEQGVPSIKKKGRSTANRDFKKLKPTSANDESSSSHTETESEKPDWNQVKKDRKELKIKRKEKDCESSEIYVLSVKAKKIWEQVRRQDCKGDTKTKLCNELFEMVKGKIKSLIYAHDTVRVIETLVGSASEEIRTQLFIELQDDIIDLSKNKYSRFFIIKLLRTGTKIQKTAIMKAIEGHVVALMKHKIASDVVELAYNDYANQSQRSSMIQEFFGPRFRLFKEDIKSLSEALEKHPDTKDQILKELSSTLDPIIEKGVFTNTIIHTLLRQYLSACDDDSRQAIIESLNGKLLPIVHTRDGARVAMMCFWHGTKKQRKSNIKSFKEHFVEIAVDEQGYLVLLAALDCIDDSVFIKKVVISELIPHLKKLVDADAGRKVVRYLTAPRDKTYFNKDVLSVLQEGDGNATTKKDLQTKYKELQSGNDGIGEPILKLVLEHISAWAKNTHWVLFVGLALKNLQGESLELIFKAIAEICAEPFIPGEGKHFLEIAYITKMITYLIQCDKQRHQEEMLTFSSILISAAEDELRGWSIVNRGCFILVKLFETEIPAIVEKMNEICQPLRNKLKKLEFPGAKILLKKLEA